ncbi:DUF480 domain-containing protein [Aliiglaciecola sp. LCG003]|uniref:YceH family protein n=1 Tax=Aliiglaciecola sp. LCG003 TaxID=3053655 RepID=UPI002572F534|nr:DUF480 domain-containing protein [Aliiglaciecola sp. LCG003]WJG10390.1 DUF480 domain-containing protein [Aliiglaciecola sp. LCG003]
MLVQLTPLQCRVIGVLLEKEITTPDQYPLSLNGLTLGCNQKSNREPVLSLSESEVQDVLDELKEMKLVNEQTGFGSRVVKYKHRFCNTEFGDLKLSRQQLAITCVMLLRGAQTPGELRTRTNRLAEFANVTEVEQVLDYMQSLNGECLVAKLPREPGKRDARYMHLFSGEPQINTAESIQSSASQMSSPDSGASHPLQARVETLENELAELKAQFNQLKEQLGA